MKPHSAKKGLMDFSSTKVTNACCQEFLVVIRTDSMIPNWLKAALTAASSKESGISMTLIVRFCNVILRDGGCSVNLFSKLRLFIENTEVNIFGIRDWKQ